MIILINLAIAITEEIFFRWFIFRKFAALMEEWPANFLTSFLFIAIHIPIMLTQYKYFGFDAFVFLWVLFFSSLLSGFLYARSKNLILPIAVHLVWNLLVIFKDLLI